MTDDVGFDENAYGQHYDMNEEEQKVSESLLNEAVHRGPSRPPKTAWCNHTPGTRAR
jgi:hypothetical protein